jgi:hypothetical protein
MSSEVEMTKKGETEAPMTGYQVSGAIGLPSCLPAMANAAVAAIIKNWC